MEVTLEEKITSTNRYENKLYLLVRLTSLIILLISIEWFLGLFSFIISYIAPIVSRSTILFALIFTLMCCFLIGLIYFYLYIRFFNRNRAKKTDFGTNICFFGLFLTWIISFSQFIFPTRIFLVFPELVIGTVFLIGLVLSLIGIFLEITRADEPILYWIGINIGFLRLLLFVFSLYCIILGRDLTIGLPLILFVVGYVLAQVSWLKNQYFRGVISFFNLFIGMWSFYLVFGGASVDLVSYYPAIWILFVCIIETIILWTRELLFHLNRAFMFILSTIKRGLLFIKHTIRSVYLFFKENFIAILKYSTTMTSIFLLVIGLLGVSPLAGTIESILLTLLSVPYSNIFLTLPTLFVELYLVMPHIFLFSGLFLLYVPWFKEINTFTKKNLEAVGQSILKFSRWFGTYQLILSRISLFSVALVTMFIGSFNLSTAISEILDQIFWNPFFPWMNFSLYLFLGGYFLALASWYKHQRFRGITATLNLFLSIWSLNLFFLMDSNEPIWLLIICAILVSSIVITGFLWRIEILTAIKQVLHFIGSTIKGIALFIVTSVVSLINFFRKNFITIIRALSIFAGLFLLFSGLPILPGEVLFWGLFNLSRFIGVFLLYLALFKKINTFIKEIFKAIGQSILNSFKWLRAHNIILTRISLFTVALVCMLVSLLFFSTSDLFPALFIVGYFPALASWYKHRHFRGIITTLNLFLLILITTVLISIFSILWLFQISPLYGIVFLTNNAILLMVNLATLGFLWRKELLTAIKQVLHFIGSIIKRIALFIVASIASFITFLKENYIAISRGFLIFAGAILFFLTILGEYIPPLPGKVQLWGPFNLYHFISLFLLYLVWFKEINTLIKATSKKIGLAIYDFTRTVLLWLKTHQVILTRVSLFTVALVCMLVGLLYFSTLDLFLVLFIAGYFLALASWYKHQAFRPIITSLSLIVSTLFFSLYIVSLFGFGESIKELVAYDLLLVNLFRGVTATLILLLSILWFFPNVFSLYGFGEPIKGLIAYGLLFVNLAILCILWRKELLPAVKQALHSIGSTTKGIALFVVASAVRFITFLRENYITISRGFLTLVGVLLLFLAIPILPGEVFLGGLFNLSRFIGIFLLYVAWFKETNKFIKETSKKVGLALYNFTRTVLSMWVILTRVSLFTVALVCMFIGIMNFSTLDLPLALFIGGYFLALASWYKHHAFRRIITILNFIVAALFFSLYVISLYGFGEPVKGLIAYILLFVNFAVLCILWRKEILDAIISILKTIKAAIKGFITFWVEKLISLVIFLKEHYKQILRAFAAIIGGFIAFSGLQNIFVYGLDIFTLGQIVTGILFIYLPSFKQINNFLYSTAKSFYFALQRLLRTLREFLSIALVQLKQLTKSILNSLITVFLASLAFITIIYGLILCSCGLTGIDWTPIILDLIGRQGSLLIFFREFIPLIWFQIGIGFNIIGVILALLLFKKTRRTTPYEVNSWDVIH
ncbi:MAG: hypothetical protein ACFFC7_28630 [Candidatus Hermodarchaeota archaeon]